MRRRARALIFCLIAMAAGLLLAAGWYLRPPAASVLPPPVESAAAEPSRSEPALPPLMDSEQREYLWQIEHHGLLLSKQGFRRLVEALSQADKIGLRHILAPQFTGAVLAQPKELQVTTPFGTIHRQTDSGPRRRVSGDEFVSSLLEFRKAFSRPPKAQMALMAFRPTTPGKLDGLWTGGAQLRVWGEATSGQPREVILVLEYEVAQPTEKRLQDGGWLHSCTITRSQTAQAPRFLMREAAAERGIETSKFHDNWRVPEAEPLVNTGGVCLCDFDRDGILDLLITDTHRHALYRGLPGGKFQNVTSAMGLPEIRTNPGPVGILGAFVDLDGDGWDDLILGDRIFRNDAGRRFVDYSSRCNLRIPVDASGVIIADYDRDGRLDVYVTRMGRGNASSWIDEKSGNATSNQLWHNRGDWQFEDVTDQAAAGGGDRSTFSAVWLDANNDGWPDLYVINEFGNGILLLNDGQGGFQACRLADHPVDFGSMGVTAGDINNDGNIDLYVANMYSKAGSRVIGNLRPGTYPEPLMAKLRSFVSGSQLYVNQGTAGNPENGDRTADSRALLAPPRFTPAGPAMNVASVGWSWGPALVDLDNDGWLDLHATCGFISKSRSEPDG